MKRVEIIWRDISFKQVGWLHKNDVDDFCAKVKEDEVHQLGYLYKETKTMIFIVDSYFPHDTTYGSVHKIPKGCIISMKNI
jgi:hypothetical protein